MWLSLDLFMENSSARIVKQTNQNICFGLVVKVSKSWLFIVLVLMPNSLLACWGGGGDYGFNLQNDTNPMDNNTRANQSSNLDNESLGVNLTGITATVERNIKVAWNGWEPPETAKNEWRDWQLAWEKENKKNGEGKKKVKKGKAGEIEDSDEDGPDVPTDDRGPASGWPQLDGWADLGKGNPGVPIPPWAYVPKNFGRPKICYLPPIKGECKPDAEKKSPGERFGFNPYMDRCESYEWSGCGGTRNRFETKTECEKRCATDPPHSCSAASGISNKKTHPFDQLQ